MGKEKRAAGTPGEKTVTDHKSGQTGNRAGKKANAGEKQEGKQK